MVMDGNCFFEGLIRLPSYTGMAASVTIFGLVRDTRNLNYCVHNLTKYHTEALKREDYPHRFLPPLQEKICQLRSFLLR